MYIRFSLNHVSLSFGPLVLIHTRLIILVEFSHFLKNMRWSQNLNFLTKSHENGSIVLLGLHATKEN